MGRNHQSTRALPETSNTTIHHGKLVSVQELLDTAGVSVEVELASEVVLLSSTEELEESARRSVEPESELDSELDSKLPEV